MAVAALLAALDSDAGLRAWWELRASLAEAESERAALQREVEHLRAEADRLESNAFAIERAIRERLRFARAGETIVRLAGPETASPRFP